MQRVQLALNVSNIDAAIDFYQRLFGVAPAKRRSGYANFVVTDPPLKLVLIESVDAEARGSGVGGALNHLGVEVDSTELVLANADRMSAEGLSTSERRTETCCFAVQDKFWVHDPDGAPWEVYTVLADAPSETDLGCNVEGGSACAPLGTTYSVPSGSSATVRSPLAMASGPCC